MAKRPFERTLHCTIPQSCSGQRLDRALATLFAQYSRSTLQRWIRDAQVRVDGEVLRPRDRVLGGEVVTVEPLETQITDYEAQNIGLDIVHEDDSILVLNKPPGLVVHPAAGNPDGTLVNALLYHAPRLRALPRAGVVHRLDKDTSGLLVVAKDLQSHAHLVQQLQARLFERRYIALVFGEMIAGGKVEAPIGRHPVERKRMAVVPGGKPAVTHYRVRERFAGLTLVDVRLETGRTHQIRVHLTHVGHPLVGDPLYGGRLRLPKAASPATVEILRGFRRQALHARTLGLRHPRTAQWLRWEAPLPIDLVNLLGVLRG